MGETIQQGIERPYRYGRRNSDCVGEGDTVQYETGQQNTRQEIWWSKIPQNQINVEEWEKNIIQEWRNV